MGFKKHQPVPKPQSGLEQVVVRVRCGEVELKLTLTTKLLVRPVRDALVEPFLKVHNKRAGTAVAWEDIACIKVEGNALDVDLDDVTAETVVAGQRASRQESVHVTLVPRASLPHSLIDGFVEVAREPPTPYSGDPPALTAELVRIASAAASEEELDSDMERRCATAFQQVGDGEDAISVAAVRSALLRDADMRALCFPAVSPHGPAIDGALRRMATNRDIASVGLTEFSSFFAALSAAACAAPEAGIEEMPIEEAYGPTRTGNSFLDELLNDESCSARRVA